MSYKLNKLFEQYKRVYFIGIKGVGMSALAIFLKEAGFFVSGSDVPDTFQTDYVLTKYKILVKAGFSPDNITPNTDLVIVTGAHGGMTNVEARKAKQLGIKTLMHGSALGMFMNEFKAISVSGCHGKTTTGGMLATILVKAQLDPSYVIGGASIDPLGPAGHFGKGQFFVAEADEYATDPLSDKTPRFMWQNPFIEIINNIEFDHPDIYKDVGAVREAFFAFAQKIPRTGLIIAGIDNTEVQKLVKNISPIAPTATFGFSPQADYQIRDINLFGKRLGFKIYNKKIIIGEFAIKIPGKHNILNATASLIAAHFIGVDIKYIKDALIDYKGVRRRLELISNAGRVALYDDYAHHPSEIKATLQGLRQWFGDRRIIVIFQPHTYSRTKALLKEFGLAFGIDPNETLITDIFTSAREKKDDSITAEILIEEISKYKNNVYYVPTISYLLRYLKTNLRPNDIIITMGAGDIYLWHKKILELISQYG